MAEWIEVVPPPTKVDIVFYDPGVGHIDVAPSSFYEDDSIVGVVLTGLQREQTYVHRGDAIIKYPDGTIIVKKAADVTAFYAPYNPFAAHQAPAPALASSNDESETLAEAVGGKKKRK